MHHTLLRFCPLLLLSLTFTANADQSQLKPVPALLTVYVPLQESKLQRRKVQGQLYNHMPTASTTYASVVAQKALPLLFHHARTSFPKGTKLVKFPEIKSDSQGDVMYVSLSKQFRQRGFWVSERQTRLAIYAIVNTAAQGYDGGELLPIQLLIEGKPLRNLANVDLRKPLRPRFDSVVKNKAN